MIQRLQTLLLLIAAICFATACFMPLGTITTFDMQYLFTPWTIKLNIADGQIIRYTYYIGIMQVVLAIWSLITIFMYKKRPLQSKMCLAMLFLNLILILLVCWIYPDVIIKKTFTGFETSMSLWSLLSVIPIAMFYFSNKLINNDEKKVRAADRLR